MAFFRSRSWRVLWPPLVFLISAAAVSAGVAQVMQVPMMHSFYDYRFFDLRVYRAATWVVVSGHPLYAAHLRHGLGFTYPPFAVLAMLPLRLVNLFHDEVLMTALNIVLVAIGAHAAVRLRQPAEHRARAAWIAAAIALWAEPVVSTIGYGQIDLLIAALVMVDLAYGRRSRVGGLGIGLAAALKLTPLIFVPYLLLTGRGRMAGRAMLTFGLSIAVAFAAVPRDALRYWSGTVFDVSRVTGRHHLSGGSPINQSLRGALVRIFPGVEHLGVVWLPACLVVACAGLVLAAGAMRRGHELHGFLLTATTGLLVSPVSWTHHWAIVVPGLIAAVTTIPRSDTRRLLTLLAAELAVASSAIWLVAAFDPPGMPLGVTGELLADPYVLFGLTLIAVAAGLALRRAVNGRRARFSTPPLPRRLRVIPEALSGP